ncbi:MAG: hypothetical protein AAB288_04285 [Acidobacteriota bacterium]
MRRVDRSIYAIFAVLAAVFTLPSGVLTQNKAAELKPTVILISLDGFRYDFVDKYKPPTLTKFAPSFPV